MRRHVALAVVVAVALVSAGCTRTRGGTIPPPPPVTGTTAPPTTVVDLSGVVLPSVPGRTTTTVALGPGRATLSGSVTGPEGPVPDAVVRAERLVGDGVASIDVLTTPEGTWTVPTVLGGRYRVRAWRAPDLALTTPAQFFMEATETKVVDLVVSSFLGYAVSAAIAPNPPLMDEPASLIVQVTQRRVDDTGIVRAVPAPGVEVELFGAGDWRVRSPNPTTTDSGGRARWQLVCRRVGEQPLMVAVAAVPYPLNLPRCGAPPPPPDDDVPGAETTTSTRATTGTRPATTTTAKPATTTTAKPATTTTVPRSTTTTTA